MSKANRQSQVLLAVVAGAMWFVDDERMFAVVKMKELVVDTRAETIKVLNNWPDSNPMDDKIVKMIGEWGDYLKTIKGYQTLPVMVKLSRQCVADIMSKVRNSYKIEMLVGLDCKLILLDEFIDPKGVNFPAYEKASEMSSRLYEIIDWRW